MIRRLKRILQSTIAKVISTVLILSFVLSGFFFFDFYLRQYNKAIGYWWIFKGDKALKKENLQEAIECYEKGIELHPTHYKAMYNLANIYVFYEDYYSALKNYERALYVKPRYEIARIDYAIILSQTYQHDEAIKEYSKVIEHAPRFYKIPLLVDNKKSYTYNRGVAYYNMGLTYRTKSLIAGLSKETSKQYLLKAAKAYEEAADILNTYNANYNLALIHQLLKNNNQAGYYYCKAIELSPMDYEAHFNYAVLLNGMKDYKHAQAEFKKAGLLLDSKGDSAKTRYIYDVLNDVNQKIAIQYDEKEMRKIRLAQDVKEEIKEEDAQYKAGKLVIDYNKKEKNDKLMKDFKTCANREYFMGVKK